MESLATRHRDLTLVPVNDELSRVLNQAGIVIGHVQLISSPAQGGTTGTAGTAGTGYVAKRFVPAQRGFRELGDFTRLSDAVDCLRAS
ncbi:MAG: hypothetical protein ACTJHU_06710 [Mycetocola sp.]